MSHLSRRSFLTQTAAAAGAVAVVGQLDGSPVSAAGPTTEAAGWTDSSVESEPFVIYIRNAAKGEVAVLSGENEIVYVDRALVGRLQRSMRRGGL
jgi:hypothetical protein